MALSAFMSFSCVDPICLGTIYEPFEGEIPPGADGTGDGGDGGDGEVLPSRKKSLYVMGVEYPDGYDWLPEIGGGEVDATLFLMKDGDRIAEVAVGNAHLVSADADMHRNIGDHIYTDFSTDDQTVIKMDGIELFRFNGRETILSMAVSGNDVYTVGKPRSGAGFTYRRNGEALVSKKEFSFLSGLYEDDGHVVFAYGEETFSAGTDKCRYYYVTDMVSHGLDVAGDVVRVDDIRVVDGLVHYIACFQDKSYRTHCVADKSFRLQVKDARPLTGLSFLYGGGDVFVKGSAGSGTVFWMDEEVVAEVEGLRVLAWSADKENVYAIASNDNSFRSLILLSEAGTVALPPEYEFVYPECMDTDAGLCCIAVSDLRNGNAPVLWIDGEAASYDFNGFFTSVSFQD